MACKTSADELKDEMVGDEATRSEKRMHSKTKRRTFVDFLTQGVTKREMRDAEVRRDLRALRALARAGAPGDHN